MLKNRRYLVMILLVIFTFFSLNESVKEMKVLKRQDYNHLGNDCIARLEIPKINLRKDLYAKASLENDVDQNLMIIGDMPSLDGQFIIAGHSGNSPIAYFNDLIYLVKGDFIIVYYNNLKYTYSISDIYDIEKSGKLYLKKSETGIIVLITCRIGTNKQTVYKGILINTESSSL